MKAKRTNNYDENEKDVLNLRVASFSKDEKKALTNARKKVGVDRPVFYHDAIVKYVNDINNGGSNA